MANCNFLPNMEVHQQMENWSFFLIEKIQSKISKYYQTNYNKPTHICLNPGDVLYIMRENRLDILQSPIGGNIQLFGLDVITTTSLVEGEILVLGC